MLTWPTSGTLEVCYAMQMSLISSGSNIKVIIIIIYNNNIISI